MVKSSPPRAAFSLVEIIVVIAIIGVLIGLLMPAIQRVRMAARKTEMKNQLRQLGLAVHDYHSVSNRLPPNLGWDLKDPNVKTPPEGSANGTIYFFLLPYLDQQNLFNSAYGPLYTDPVSKATCGIYAYRANLLGNAYVKTYYPTSGGGRYMYVGNGNLFSRLLSLNKITDGTTQTMMFTEGFSNAYIFLGSEYCGYPPIGQKCVQEPGYEYNGIYYNGPLFCMPTYSTTPMVIDCPATFPYAAPGTGGCEQGGSWITRIGDNHTYLSPSVIGNNNKLWDPTGHAASVYQDIHVLMADGSVHVVSFTVSPSSWWASFTPDANDIVGEDYFD